MSTICTAPACQLPALNGFLCRNCADVLTRDLKAVPWLLEELEVTVCRQDKLTDSSDRSSDERPLPIRIHAMEARRDLNTTLASWALHTAGRFNGLDRSVIWTELRLAQYLLAHVGDLLTDPAAGECADEIGYAVKLARRTIDKPVQQVFVGPCDDCGTDLYAHPSAAQVICVGCGLDYDIEARRRWLLGKAEDQLLTATEMSRALPGLLGRDLSVDKLKGLLRRRRDRITQHPPLPDRPRESLYKVGDVIDMFQEIADGEARQRPARIAS